jgi:hypothetical protein
MPTSTSGLESPAAVRALTVPTAVLSAVDPRDGGRSDPSLYGADLTSASIDLRPPSLA